jgi:integrase
VAKTTEELITEANARLRAAQMRVSIALKRNTLYLRAKLPPKPDSGKGDWHQQWISLGGIYGNAAGVKRAEAEAQRLRYELAMDKFRWADWLAPDRSGERTVEQWAKAYEEAYFGRRQRAPKTETTWDKDYSIPYARLAQVADGKPLTAQAILAAVQTYAPDTRSRQRAVTAYGRLAEFAGVEVDLSGLRGRYSPAAVDPRDLPTDDQIIEAVETLADPRWRLLVALMATYGLRDHEVFHADLKTITTPPGVCVVQDGKTGWHEVWPYPPEWWERWICPWVSEGVLLPPLTARQGRNDSYGTKVAQHFKRKGIPFRPYDLRHAWAARTAVYGLDPAIAAKMMGHDLSIHSRVYHRFLNRASMQQAWERSQGK